MVFFSFQKIFYRSLCSSSILSTTFDYISIGDTLQLNVTISPDDAENKNVNWESSNDLLASVSSTGNVEALGAGDDIVITVTSEDGGYTDECVIDINPPLITGIIDTDFIPGTGANGELNAVAIQNDGKILIGGDFSDYNGTEVHGIARLNSNGTLDTSFNTGTGIDGWIYNIFCLEDSIIIVGEFGQYNGVSRNSIVKVDYDGNIDMDYDPRDNTNSDIDKAAVYPDGRLLIAGNFGEYSGSNMEYFCRINADGSMDTTFNQTGAGANANIYSMIIKEDETIIIGGGFTTYNTTSRSGLALLNADGTLNNGFDPGTGCDDEPGSICLFDNGDLLVSSSMTVYNTTPVNGMVLINPDGSIDNSFDPGTGFLTEEGDSGHAAVMCRQFDGSIIISGYFVSYNGTEANNMVRLLANGTLDPSFSAGSGTGDDVMAMAFQQDGKLVIAGSLDSYNGTDIPHITRLE